MSYWPDGMRVQPIVQWPGALTRSRAGSPFASTLSSTMNTLRRELRELGAKDVLLQIAVPREKFRLDGYPRETAVPEHPGLILTMDSRVGPLSYPCDTFTTWQDNLRAIALALEALRKVDRYGVTKRGEQYRGFLAIESTAMPAGFSTWQDAWKFLEDASGLESDVFEPPESRAPRIVRWAKRHAHPDTGGDTASFQRVTLAEAKLREEGLL